MKHKVPWEEYENTCLRWITSAIDITMQNHQAYVPGNAIEIAIAALDCLINAKKYLETAFHAFSKGYIYVGMCCTRPVFEMAISYRWCMLDKNADEQKRRIRSWLKNTYWSNFKAIEQHLEKPDISEKERNILEERKKEFEKHFADVKKRPDLRTMLEKLPTSDPDTAKTLYTELWEELCAGSHGGFDPERSWITNSFGDYFHKKESISPKLPWAVVSTAYAIFAVVFESFGWDQGSVPEEYKCLATKKYQRIT